MSNTDSSDCQQLMPVNDNPRRFCPYRSGNNIHCSFDFFSLISVTCLLIGFALITLGYAIPRDYKFDPHKPARVMEAIEAEYGRKRIALNVCIMIGTGFVTLSGLIISVVVTWELCSNQTDTEETEEPEPPDKPPSYGSVCGGNESAPEASVASSSGTDAMLGNTQTER